MGRENRLNPRVLVRVPGEYRVGRGEGWTSGLLHDLSVSGAGLLTRSPLGLQAEVRLRFHLPDATEGEADPPVEVSCLVVRGGRLGVPDEGFQCFSGLHFLPLRDEAYERLRVFVWNNLDQEAP